MLSSATYAQSALVEVDAGLPVYKSTSGISGTLKSVGSDSMNNLMTLWAEEFNKIYPNIKIEIEGKGSSTAPPALIAGSADFGPMSRPMKEKEIDDFKKAFGYEPTEISTAVDVLAVYVNKDNPIKGLTLAQVDAIFSKTRKSGYKSDIASWGEAGLEGDWASQPISIYGRNAASGTYGFFKEHVMGNGDFKDTVKEQPGSSNVVQGVAGDIYGIGYSGIGYKTADVNAVPLAPAEGEPFVEANGDNAYSGEYPLTRSLYLYVNYNPNAKIDPLRREFIKFILSKQGQEVVAKDGYFPITADMAKEVLDALNLK